MDSDDSALLKRELELENKELREKMKEKISIINDLHKDIENLSKEKDIKQEEIDMLNREILSIKSGRAYKFAQKVKKFIK